jgi:ligand-binding sensor domain-containing protein/serine phosphatase RsbU (regulator of sigma subunit)
MISKLKNGYFRILVIIGSILTGTLSAQEDVFFDRLDVPQGLSSSNVRSICQDQYGFLWIGTDDGLNRYDGYKFDVFKNDPSDSNSLADSRVERVFLDSKGDLWVTTQGGISKWNRNRENFDNIPLDFSLSSVTNDEWFWAIYEDRIGRFWLGTRFGGLLLFNPESKTVVAAKKLYEDGVARVFGGPVAAVVETASGEIYSADFPAGLIKYNEEKKYFEPLNLSGMPEGRFADVGIFVYHEDKTGSLWLATQGGVFRIDPERENIEKIRLTDSPEKNFIVYTILEDEEGNLWFGSAEGLYQYNLKTRASRQFRTSNSDIHSLSANPVWCSYKDNFGVLWFGTLGGGLSKYDPKKIAFKSYADLKGVNQTSNHGVYSITKNPGMDQVYWLSTDDGVYRFDRGKNTYNKLNLPEMENAGAVRSLIADEKGYLWIATQTAGLLRYQSQTKQLVAYPSDPQHLRGLNSDNVYDLELDDYGTLWIGTSAGLNRLNPQTDSIVRIPSLETRNYDQTIISFIDSLFRREKPVAAIREVGDYADLTQEFELSDSADFLITTVGEGLRNWNLVDFGWLENEQGDTVWAMNDLYRTFHLSGATKNRIEVSVLNLKPGKFKLRYKSDDSHSYAKWNSDSPSDSLWWGMNLFKIPVKDSGRFESLIKGDLARPFIEGLDIRALEYSSKGFLWVGTEYGLSRYEIKSRQVTNYVHQPGKANSLSSNEINYLLEDKNGLLWIATSRGLNKFEPDADKFIVYTEKDGLPSDQLRALAEDDAGNLWISSVNGLTKFEKSRNSESPVFVNYDVQDGLQGYQFYNRSVFRGIDGEMFFGGRNGFNAFFPGITNTIAPRVALSQIFISNQKALPGAEDSPLDRSIFDTKEIILSHAQNDLSFEFAPLHFSRPDKNQVAYKLDGFDDQWINNGRRFTSYTNLDPGDYAFRIRAVSSDGIIGTEEKILRITINKPWWNTTWAYISYGFIFILGVFTIDRVQRFRLTQRERSRAMIREAELRAQVAEAENERKTKELDEARHLQLSLLPEKLPVLPHLEIAVYMKTATEVGGDYYDYNIASDGTLNIVFGDATGHGMRAGTVVTLMKGLFSADSGNIKIEKFLDQSSATIKDLRFERALMALTLLKIKDKQMLFSSAGMPPAYLYRKNRKRVEEICLESVPLGAMKDYHYQVREDVFEPGDTLLLLSDGLPELKDPNGLIFDYPRVEQAFREVASDEPQLIIDRLAAVGDAWRQDIALEDDITFMVIKAR